MKRTVTSFLGFLFVWIVAVAGGREADSTGFVVRVGDMAPDFTLRTADGSQVSLSALRGRVVMLQFTASWCGVCRKEMPFIEREIWQKHRTDTSFCLIGIDRDEPLERVKAFARQTKVTYPLALDSAAVVFSRYALPESGVTRNVLIGRDGRIVKTTRLFNETEFRSLVKAIDALLKKN